MSSAPADRARPGPGVPSGLRVPGDKSLSQRALILAALAEGRSRLSGLLAGGDATSTAAALRALGVRIGPLEDGRPVDVDGVGLRGLVAPSDPLDLGNSGTGARLLMGVLAGAGVPAVLTGDASLRSRPMARIVEPLRAMGARIEYLEEEGRLPVRLSGGDLGPLEWSSPVASAQVKSALLLAGVTSGAFVLVTEPRQSRDHTERLLTGLGAPVVAHAVEGGWRVELRDPPGRLSPLAFEVPGDVSSAAFLLAFAALRGGGGALTVDGVGLNPTRTAFLEVLARMGADVDVTPEPSPGPEPVGSIAIEAPDALIATEVGGEEVPRLIDELPLVAILGAQARGTTRITGAEELRAKESDRIRTLYEGLRALGVDVHERPDGLDVVGGPGPFAGRIATRGDHRIAMAFGVLGALPGHRVEVDEPEAADVSFPGFWALLRRAAEVGA